MNKKLFALVNASETILRKLVFSFIPAYRCIVCNAESDDLPVCYECRQKYFKVDSIKNNNCQRCGKKLISEKKLCMQCRSESILHHVNSVFPLFSYRLWSSEALCRWKLKDERIFSSFFAGLLRERLLEIFHEKGSYVIVPVPPRPGKIKEKGWDQIEELAVYLENVFKLPLLRLLERYSSVEQKSLDKEGRKLSIGKSYGVKRQVKNIPKKICLLDDVMTTGATIESCALKLKEAGSEEVIAVTLFIVDR